MVSLISMISPDFYWEFYLVHYKREQTEENESFWI